MECFGRLIATPSVSSIDARCDQSNRDIIVLIANWLDLLGFAIDLLPVSEEPEKYNLVARLGEGGGGLVLAGHTDTVPYDEAGWRTDPFRLTEIDGRLFGLGASDMKGFFACVLEALRVVTVDRLRHPLYVLATADEESNMQGARALVESGVVLGRHAVIGEPTGLAPVHMHKGVLHATIRLIGRSGHASDPTLGVSALDGMHRVMGALLDWRRELAAHYHDPAFKVPEPTLNLGSIRGGDSPNRICAECELCIDMRLVPGMDLDTVKDDLRVRARTAVRDFDLRIEFREPFGGIDPFAMDRDAEIVRVAERLSGRPPGAVAFGTEGPYLSRLGMETVILGPGDIEVAHQANEYLDVDRIEPMVKILQGMIQHFCIGAD
jgi:acetylornithine deacetylase